MPRYVDIDKLRKNVKPWLDDNVLVIPLSAIDEAEIEDVRPVTHALWKSKDSDYFHSYNDWYCSNCGKFTKERYRFNLGNYCPHCGSKMSIRFAYKDVFCDFEWSKDDKVFFGKIVDDNNLITFEDTSLLGAIRCFKEFVDDEEGLLDTK